MYLPTFYSSLSETTDYVQERLLHKGHDKEEMTEKEMTMTDIRVKDVGRESFIWNGIIFSLWKGNSRDDATNKDIMTTMSLFFWVADRNKDFDRRVNIISNTSNTQQQHTKLWTIQDFDTLSPFNIDSEKEHIHLWKGTIVIITRE